ncbi:MAG: DUF2892 domain-containing protein [Prolixibacteraceae bacterium]|jgi:hypothetical protein
MFHNVGKTDRIIRIILAVLFAILYFTNLVEGKWAEVSIIVAIVLAMTSLRQCCPLYAILGFGTCGVKSDKSETTIKTEKLKL